MLRRRAPSAVLLAVALLLLLPAACGEKDDGKASTPRPGAGSATSTDEGGNMVIVQTSDVDDAVEDVVDGLLKTRSPTDALVAALPGGRDPHTVYLIDRLRGEILRRENGAWQSRDKEDYWGERRCCSVEALRWHRGVSVEVHRLQLPASLADQHGGKPGFAPLRTSKIDCLGTAVREGKLLGSYGPIILRGGETARLTAGWTRARLGVQEKDGGALEESCTDAFAGLRVSLTARVRGGEAGTWELGVFVVTAELRSESGTLTEGGEFGQDSASAEQSDDSETRFDLARQEKCWLAVMTGPYGATERQVLLCARLVDLE